MLTDPHEIQIINKARQKNVRDPHRSREHFERIFADFLTDLELEDSTLLDLGPGQYDFTVLARERGATVNHIDSDPAVVELGRYKGFEVVEGNLKTLRARDWPRPFDGIFCKFSINAFWFGRDEERLRSYIGELGSLMAPDAWSWIAPWNGAPKKTPLDSETELRILAVQASAFAELGFQGIELSEKLARYYGVNGQTANRALFVRNLPLPRRVERARPLP